MPSIQVGELPQSALLRQYAGGAGYTDCFFTETTGAVAHDRFVQAFYTTAVFRPERVLIALLAAKLSTDRQARELAQGQREAFSAWTVEARTADQLLMADLGGRTRSWFMTEPLLRDGQPWTRLYFGSAIVPVRDPISGQESIGWVFQSLLGFHKLYSRVLLSAAASRVLRA